jgi:hypothetical protein
VQAIVRTTITLVLAADVAALVKGAGKDVTRVWTDCPQRESDALLEPAIVGCEASVMVTVSSE